MRKLHFPYEEVNTRILVSFLRSTSSIIIFLAYSVFVFFFSEMTYSYNHSRFPRACQLDQLTPLSVY